MSTRCCLLENPGAWRNKPFGGLSVGSCGLSERRQELDDGLVRQGLHGANVSDCDSICTAGRGGRPKRGGPDHAEWLERRLLGLARHKDE